MQQDVQAPNYQVLLEQTEAKLQASYQTIDELLKVNLELKAHVIMLQKNFQNVVKQQNDSLTKLAQEKKELEEKLKVYIPDNKDVPELAY